MGFFVLVRTPEPTSQLLPKRNIIKRKFPQLAEFEIHLYLSSFMTNNLIMNTTNTTDATCRAGIAYQSRVPDIYCGVFCGSVFVVFVQLYFISFDMRLLRVSWHWYLLFSYTMSVFSTNLIINQTENIVFIPVSTAKCHCS